MIKHTPGPLLVDQTGFRVRDCYPGGHLHRVIAECGPGWSEANREEAEANALLFAAGPDLLAALKRVLYELTVGDGDVSIGWEEDAKAAIAKAEDRS